MCANLQITGLTFTSVIVAHSHFASIILLVVQNFFLSAILHLLFFVQYNLRKLTKLCHGKENQKTEEN